ncbi:MAG: DUF1648 domain-containing protein [Ignavibacteriota bacterium]
MKDPRPRMTPNLTSVDKAIESLGWALLLMLWVFTLLTYSSLPETIPTHFNIAGKADNYGGKITIIIMPIIGTVIFIGLSILNKFPHIFNYPRNITEENALRQYTIATRLIRYLKSGIAFISLLLVYLTSRAALESQIGIGWWGLPLVLCVIFIPVIVYSVKSFKAK